ncbi:hypothetical protein C448_11871 [Halococcus morrhuae DSM 1307]|uniref:DUF3784 domain-containing protein n=1 Tax=Halococcus morrhuae DSM 1307 TaxID=931277 RepID=M0M8V0_HALMO|nr:DUF3784 domain-containing protein [Halococcus morrhuae]EMA42227.1 hypothetical protein C448_11871 [Halococcus morrhuae DSM 1307]
MALGRVLLVGASGLSVVLIGYLIKYRGMVGLIAGYDSDEVVDESGLAEFAGTLTILIGVVTILTGVLDHFEIGNGVLWYVFVVFVVGAAGMLIVGSNRYTAR